MSCEYQVLILDIAAWNRRFQSRLFSVLRVSKIVMAQGIVNLKWRTPSIQVPYLMNSSSACETAKFLSKHINTCNQSKVAKLSNFSTSKCASQKDQGRKMRTSRFHIKEIVSWMQCCFTTIHNLPYRVGSKRPATWGFVLSKYSTLVNFCEVWGQLPTQLFWGQFENAQKFSKKSKNARAHDVSSTGCETPMLSRGKEAIGSIFAFFHMVFSEYRYLSGSVGTEQFRN